MEKKAHTVVAEIFSSALKAVSPYESVQLNAGNIRSVIQNSDFKRLIVIGFGKASCRMAKAVEDSLVDIVDTGIIITKYSHCDERLEKIRVFEAGHPLPDEHGLHATEEVISLLKKADEQTFVVCLISGGGSALLVSPYQGITLTNKQAITDFLMKAGADIYELNTIRKHISSVKGGRLAEIAYPAKVLSLILSDVIGDRLDVIASGPTSPDRTTFDDALNVLRKYQLSEVVPAEVLDIIHKGLKGLVPDTPKEDNRIFEKVENIIIGSNKKALNAAKSVAESLGLYAEIISSEITGEAKDIGTWLAHIAIETRNTLKNNHTKKTCLISGGETTVTVRGNGKGGRNTELALSFAMQIEGIDGITLLSAGTDGTDGPTDAAGAIIDGNTIRNAKSRGIDSRAYLRNNDSYHFFKEINELFITGPTGTNVMDVQIMHIE